MSAEVIDPDSAAGIASQALDRSLAALRQVLVAAKAADASASAAAAVQTAVSVMLAAIGIDHRWTGTLLQLRLPDGSYGPAVDLQGIQGEPGETPTFHIGQVTTGPVGIVIHVDDPLNPIVDFTIPAGANGWTPVPAIVADGTRCVVQVVDWTGGTGPKPAGGQFVGPAGFVSTASAGTDLRGLPGTGTVNHTGSTTPGHLAVFGVDGDHILDGGALTAFGASLVAAIDKSAAKALLQIVVGDVAGAAPLASPALTGTPTVPNRTAGDSSGSAANTAFVAAAIQAIVGMAPAQLDTLQEIAAQLSSDESTAAALATTVSGKLAKALNLSDLANAAVARTNLGVAIGSNVQAWDADLDAIAALSTTAYGRGLLTLASAVALTAAVNAFAGDAGSGGTKGLVPAPAAGDAAAGKLLRADGTWAASSAAGGGAPSAYNTRALPYTATLADKGTTINPAGTGVLTLPAATAVSGWYAWIKKRDDGGAATLTPASGTIDGLASIRAYKEELLVYYDAAASTAASVPVYRTQGRQRGWIDFGSFSVTSGTAGVTITAGAGDAEIRDLDVDVENYVPSVSDGITIAMLQAGSAGTSSGEYILASAGAISSGSTAGLSFSAATTTPRAISLVVKNMQSTAANTIRAWFSVAFTGYSLDNKSVMTTAGAFSSISLTPTTGTISSMLYNVRLYRP